MNTAFNAIFASFVKRSLLHLLVTFTFKKDLRLYLDFVILLFLPFLWAGFSGLLLLLFFVVVVVFHLRRRTLRGAEKRRPLCSANAAGWNGLSGVWTAGGTKRNALVPEYKFTTCICFSVSQISNFNL